MFKLVVFSTFLAVATSSPDYLAAPLIISHGPVVATTLDRSPLPPPEVQGNAVPLTIRNPAIRPAPAPPLPKPIVYGARHGYDDDVD